MGLETENVVGLVVLALLEPFLIFFAVLFWIRRDRHPIKMRLPWFAMISVVWSIIDTTFRLSRMIAYPNYPCLVDRWLMWLTFPIYGNAYLIRGFYLYYMHRLQQVRFSLAERGTRVNAGELMRDFFIQHYAWIRPTRLLLIWAVALVVEVFAFMVPLSFGVQLQDATYCDPNGVIDGIPFWFAVVYVTGYGIEAFLLWKHKVGENFNITTELKTVVVGWFFAGVAVVVTDLSLNQPYNKSYDEADRTALATYLYFPIIGGFVLTWLMAAVYPVVLSYKNAPDQDDSSRDLTSSASGSKIHSHDEGNDIELSKHELNSNNNNNNNEGSTTPYSTLSAAAGGSTRTSTPEKKDKASSVESSKQNHMPGLRDLLCGNRTPDCTEADVRKFEQFLQREFCIENIFFWRAVEAYRKMVAQLNEDKDESVKMVLGEAQHVYDQFVVENAPFQVNISELLARECRRILDAISKHLLPPSEKEIEIATVSRSESGDLQRKNALADIDGTLLHLFDKSQSHIYSLLKNDAYLRFQKTYQNTVELP